MSDTYSILLEPPLRQLLSMQSRGRVRRTWKRLWSPRRAITTSIVLVLFLLYCIQIYIALTFNNSFEPVRIELVAPIGLMGILLLKLLSIFIDRTKSAAGFRSEETHCLVAGPFSHQQVRLFRVCGHAISIFFTSLFAAIFFRFHVSSFVAALCGSYLAMLFTYLVHTLCAIAACHASETTYRRARNLGCGLAIGVLCYLLYRVSLTGASNTQFLRVLGNELVALGQTTVGQVVVSPFWVFTNIIVASSYFDCVLWTALGLVLNYLALQAVMRAEVFFVRREFDQARAEFRENESELLAPKLDANRVDLSRFKQALPVLWGAGPIIWRQVRAIRRIKGGLGWLLIPMGLAFAAGGYLAFDAETGALQTIAVIVTLTSVFLPGLLPFDFRGDLKGLTALKMMPLRPLPVVLGQLVVPVVLLSAFQLLALSTLLLHDSKLVGGVLLTFCFLLPTNTIIIALENLIFLLYPYKVADFDMPATIRRIVMLMAKFCVIFLAAIFAFASGLLIAWFRNWMQDTSWNQFLASVSWPALIVSQMIGLSLLACLVVWMTCWAYHRFDLSEDLPS